MLRTRTFLSLALLVGALTLGAPALAQDSPPTYVPPAGWSAIVWASPTPDSGFADNVNLLRASAASLAYADLVDTSRKQLLASITQKFDGDVDEKCGPDMAHRFSYAMTSGGHDLSVVQLMRIVGDSQYVLTYVRLATHPADPSVIASMRSLCGATP